MTLLAALRCQQGVVLTSDSRETSGPAQGRVARNVTKIYQPRKGLLVAWAGWENVAQAFALALERAEGLSPALDRVEIKKRLEGLIAQIRAEGETDLAEWIVAWWSKPDDMPVALQLFSARSGKWIGTSIGGDVQLAAVRRTGIEVVTGAKLRGLHDALDLWEEQSAELLPGGVAVPAQSATPDRGIRPPGQSAAD
ncbi:MAG: hypothetical protein ACRDPC_18655 [Solirubrobacteraceae bacterium]